MELFLIGLAFICLGAAIRYFADALLDYLLPVVALLGVSVLGAFGLSELSGWPLPLTFVVVGLPVVLFALMRPFE
ncbi:hypothetical protein [Catellatospora vulcania]|uniref:hypothetical protein n=1 Tax=Catellatospora vulcania TaxID=1460450 RepID=UPI0012D3801B|nr:hypothetical protein [Catellatospora vulcania]